MRILKKLMESGYFAIKGISPLKIFISKIWFNNQEEDKKNNSKLGIETNFKNMEKILRKNKFQKFIIQLKVIEAKKIKNLLFFKR